MGEQPSFLKNVSLRLLFSLPVRFKGFIILPLLTRMYSNEMYGAWLQILLIGEILKNLLSLQFGPAIVRYLSAETDQPKIIRSVLTTTILLSFFFIIVTLVFSKPLCRLFFGRHDFKVLLVVSSVWIMIQACMRIGLSVLRSQEKIGRLSIRELLSSLWLISSVIVSFQNGWTLDNLILICSAGDFILLGWILIQIGTPFPLIAPRTSWLIIKKFLPFSLPLIFGSLFLWITRSVDRFLIVKLLGLSDLAIYGVSLQVAGILLFILKPINFVLFPRTSSAWNQNNKEEVSRCFSQAVTMTIIISLPIITGIFMTSKGLIQLLAGQTFSSNSTIIIFLLFSCMALMIYQNHLFIIQLIEKTYLLPILFVFTAGVNLVTGYFMVKSFGITGAAISRLITLVIMASVITLWARQYVKFEIPWLMVAKIALASLLMGTAIKGFPMGSWLELFLKIATGTIIFLVAIMLLKVINRGTWSSLKSQF